MYRITIGPRSDGRSASLMSYRTDEIITGLFTLKILKVKFMAFVSCIPKPRTLRN